MTQCKRCQSESIIKNGIVREKPRHKCKSCGYNFIEGDGRFKRKSCREKGTGGYPVFPWKSFVWHARKNIWG